MIRGVNKNIIEVLDPEDKCFEKIIFFLNPNTKAEDSLLSRKTGEYLNSLSKNVKKQAGFRPLTGIVCALCGGVCASGILLLIQSLF